MSHPNRCATLQELLKSQDRQSSSEAGQQALGSSTQASGAAETSTDDLVPISAWLGQPSEPMDQRIAEEALLAGVDYASDAMDAEGALSASSGSSVLAPGAAEGLASAPLQLQQGQQPGSTGEFDASQSTGDQSNSSLPRQGGKTPGAESAERQPDKISKTGSTASTTQSAVQQARDGERRQEAYRSKQSSTREAAEGPSSDALQDQQSTGLASAQEAYREDGSAETGMHPWLKAPRPGAMQRSECGPCSLPSKDSLALFGVPCLVGRVEPPKLRGQLKSDL